MTSWGHVEWVGIGSTNTLRDAAAEAQRQLDEERLAWADLRAHIEAVNAAARTMADAMFGERLARDDTRDTGNERTRTTGVRVILPGTLEYRGISDRTAIQAGPIDPCRFPGVAPKITAMQ